MCTWRSLAFVVLGIAAPTAAAEDLTSQSFILRAPTLNAGKAITLQGPSPDSEIGTGASWLGPPSIGTSEGAFTGITLRPLAPRSIPNSSLDTDVDGVDDATDNCTQRANASQLDSDQDGYGNICDPDFDNNGSIGVSDFNLLRAHFGRNQSQPSYDPRIDLDGNGGVGISDFNAFRSYFGGAPGPSGLGCAGTTPCASH
jgi:hypothetical protein